MTQVLKAAQEAASFFKMIMELPEASRAPLLKIHETAMANLELQMAPMSSPSPSPFSLASSSSSGRATPASPTAFPMVHTIPIPRPF